MKKFLVTYLAPASVIDDWKKTEPKQRKDAEEKMQGELAIADRPAGAP